MYAVFLEHLITNLRNVLVLGEARRSVRRTLTLWVNFPVLMWSRRRSLLRAEAEGVPSSSASAFCAAVGSQRATMSSDEQVEQAGAFAPRAKAPAKVSRRGRGLGPKRVAFEAALKDQMRSGDLRLFSEDERERNAAAYQAAASLPAPLSRGTARRYVVQALPRLEESRALYK
jgi:hypothetical protein